MIFRVIESESQFIEPLIFSINPEDPSKFSMDHRIPFQENGSPPLHDNEVIQAGRSDNKSPVEETRSFLVRTPTPLPDKTGFSDPFL